MKKLVLYLLTALMGLGIPSTVNAAVFSIDSFTVVRDGDIYCFPI